MLSNTDILEDMRISCAYVVTMRVQCLRIEILIDSPTVDRNVPKIPGNGQMYLQGGGARQHL